jgi:hypothetical protein
MSCCHNLKSGKNYTHVADWCYVMSPNPTPSLVPLPPKNVNTEKVFKAQYIANSKCGVLGLGGKYVMTQLTNCNTVEYPDATPKGSKLNVKSCMNWF